MPPRRHDVLLAHWQTPPEDLAGFQLELGHPRHSRVRIAEGPEALASALTAERTEVVVVLAPWDDIGVGLIRAARASAPSLPILAIHQRPVLAKTLRDAGATRTRCLPADGLQLFLDLLACVQGRRPALRVVHGGRTPEPHGGR